jgi:hypothetical protein
MFLCCRVDPQHGREEKIKLPGLVALSQSRDFAGSALRHGGMEGGMEIEAVSIWRCHFEKIPPIGLEPVPQGMKEQKVIGPGWSRSFPQQLSAALWLQGPSPSCQHPSPPK